MIIVNNIVNNKTIKYNNSVDDNETLSIQDALIKGYLATNNIIENKEHYDMFKSITMTSSYYSTLFNCFAIDTTNKDLP